jgi:hypothetical protein
MNKKHCPHCGEPGFPVERLPREVVAILVCRHCNELSVMFRKTVIALNRKVLESGTFDERKEHLATVIAHFLEAGIFPFDMSGTGSDGAMFELPQGLQLPQRRRKKPALPVESYHAPITEQERDRFVQVDLKCIDNPAYFRKIFG